MAKTLKVEITVREDDGRTVVKSLEGTDAEEWSKYVEQVCTLAFTHDANPDWGSLNWQKKEIG
ncbi:MAG: hypothetical protein DMF76_27595, partial [Acidobacteria bacterium]